MTIISFNFKLFERLFNTLPSFWFCVVCFLKFLCIFEMYREFILNEHSFYILQCVFSWRQFLSSLKHLIWMTNIHIKKYPYFLLRFFLSGWEYSDDNFKNRTIEKLGIFLVEHWTTFPSICFFKQNFYALYRFLANWVENAITIFQPLWFFSDTSVALFLLRFLCDTNDLLLIFL